MYPKDHYAELYANISANLGNLRLRVPVTLMLPGPMDGRTNRRVRKPKAVETVEAEGAAA